VSQFYSRRWSLFLDVLLNATITGAPVDWDSYAASQLAFSRAWGVNDTQAFPASPSGADPTALAAGVLAKYATGNAGSFTALPDTDAGIAPAASFFQVGGANEAAVSPDCPFTAHGPGDSLAVCQAACGADPVCTTINWNVAISDCVFRACAQPGAPQLTPTDGYVVWSSNSSKGAGMLQAWHTDVDVLMVLCEADPDCRGFSSLGVLKANVSATVAAAGVTLYVKTAAAGAAGAVAAPPAAAGKRRRGGRAQPSGRPNQPQRRHPSGRGAAATGH